LVLVLLARDRRRIRHVAVTAHPTAAWTPQPLREASPWDEAPRYLILDRDHAFDGFKATAKAMGMEEVVTAAIDTNAERPDRAAPNGCTRAAPQLPGTVLRQRNTPAAGP
jgi:hypothetical protein